ncbi:heterokaryon incompatibility protein-domain-containing protein [Halenospora varia]|nr:heterokaryon incompatibility protein-domain-containing protein [Halenospora varia]
MGYSQLWEIKSRKRWLEVWPKLVADTRMIVDAADIDLTSDRIWDMNEVEREYGGSEEAVQRLLYPPAPIIDEQKGIIFNGIQSDGCEPFILQKDPEPRYEHIEELGGSCKTNRRPYDTVVCAVLIRAKQLLRKAIYVGMPAIAEYDNGDDGWERGWSIISLLWPEVKLPVEDEPKEYWDSEDEEIILNEDKTASTEPRDATFLPPASAPDPENKTTRNQLQEDVLPLDIPSDLLDTIRQWIGHCNDAYLDHSTCHPPRRTRHLPLLRLIDVERQCIVPAPLDTSYVALSYVWGSFPQTRLMSSNVAQMLEDEGFRKHKINVSKTIADSMALCQQLGYRYLWVDAYCILQDNSHDKVLQLNTMREVYSNAALTIVAAHGDHANSGLGLEHMWRSSLSASKVPDVWHSFENALSKTVWESRGWTFQEKVLSRRILLFSLDGPFFVCKEWIQSVQGSQRVKQDSIYHNRPGCFFNIKSGVQLEAYLRAVQHYSKRQLTVEDDFENAIRGIMKSFGYSMDSRANCFFQGLPTTFFDELFCWRVSEHNPKARRPGFPSWSWQGWKQTPLFPDMMMNDIRKKREKSLWGSRILAYDRGNYENITSLDGFFVNNSGPNPIMLKWKGGPLEVSMESSEDAGATNGLFRVFSPVNGQDAGMIQLDKKWRAAQPATMEFLPVFSEKENDKVRARVLMCLEHSKQESRGGAPPWAKWERVQLMDCDVEEGDWMSMMAGSATFGEEVGSDIGWIY